MITCFYHRLVQAVRWHWEQWADEKNSPIKSQGARHPKITVTSLLDPGLVLDWGGGGGGEGEGAKVGEAANAVYIVCPSLSRFPW